MDSLYNQDEILATTRDEQFSGLDSAQNINQDKQVELYKKYLYFNRSHNLRTTRFAYQAIVDPAMIIMLNHFYDAEIKNKRFRNIDLEMSIENMFNDIKINNL